MKETVLTGDRPTGGLHIGHLAGSLLKRVELQYEYEKPYIMIADMQALTDNAYNPQKVRENVYEVAYDYLACGIKPELNTIFIQSLIPELSHITMLYLNFVTLARLKRNPTVKQEMKNKGFKEDVPAGFLTYPISQVADITAFKATLIPVGQDQLPMIEQTNELVRTINNRFDANVLKECKPLLSNVTRLVGTDGKGKMGKSTGNAVFLSDHPDTITKKVMGMYTDPGHITVQDPGKVEGNAVFAYLDAFDPDKVELFELKQKYEKGGLGDLVLKKRLNGILQQLLDPIRKARIEYQKNPDYVSDILKKGSEHARDVAISTLLELNELFSISYFK